MLVLLMCLAVPAIGISRVRRALVAAPFLAVGYVLFAQALFELGWVVPVWAPIIALGFGVIGTAYANSHAIAPGPHPSTAAAEAHDSKLDGALRRLTDTPPSLPS